MNKLQRAKQLLDKNEEQQEVHFTSDGFPFFKKAQAESHASRLADKAIETITREQANEAEEPAGDDAPAVKPLSKMNKTELQAEVAKRPGLTIAEGTKNKDIVEAIEKFDAEQKEPAKPEVTEAGETKE